jgi:iodotyrosine deiodinase
MDNTEGHIPYSQANITPDEQLRLAQEFYQQMNQRRSVRFFDTKPLPVGLLELLIQTAGTAPSGAHKQPWTFCVVTNATLKQKIKEAAEAEEYETYSKRMSAQWKEDLAPIGTDWQKPFLTDAPALVILFKRSFEYDDPRNTQSAKLQNYYVTESCGIAAGLFIAAVHNAGLVTLTHTPSPMDFLTKLLDRPANEKAFLLMPIGYPAANCTVPNFGRKPLDQIMNVY